MRVKFKVSFELPEDASVSRAKGYVDEAVASWHGSLEPHGAYGPDSVGDPMFYLNSKSVRVTRIRAKKP